MLPFLQKVVIKQVTQHFSRKVMTEPVMMVKMFIVLIYKIFSLFVAYFDNPLVS